MEKKEVENKLEQSLAQWSKKVDVAEYLKSELGQVDKGSGNTHIEDIINNAIRNAKAEIDPKWTKVLLDNIRTPNQTINNSININPQDDFVLKFCKGEE